MWEQDSFELYLSLGLSDPQTYLELDIAPAGGFFGGLIHNPSGRTGNDAFPLGVAYDPAHPWMVEGVDCADVQVQRMMAGLHWNVTRHEPTVEDLATVRADFTVPVSALRGHAGARGETFGSLDGQTGAGGPAWVTEWYDNANSEPDGRVMRKFGTCAASNSGLCHESPQTQTRRLRVPLVSFADASALPLCTCRREFLPLPEWLAVARPEERRPCLLRLVENGLRWSHARGRRDLVQRAAYSVFIWGPCPCRVDCAA